jgi:predicted RNase H-like HicB family nuclease
MFIKNGRFISNMVLLTAIVQKESDMYVATCAETGTVSQGKTVEEALANLKESTELYLEEFPLKASPRPLVTTFEVENKARA